MIRGENGPGGWAFREAEGNPNRTEYMWLFDVDLKVKTEIRFTFFFFFVRVKIVFSWYLMRRWFPFFLGGGAGAGLVGNAVKQTLVTRQPRVANSSQIDPLV